MSRCAVEECEAEIEKKGHTLCLRHWRAQRAGELTVCDACGRLKENDKPRCLACYRAGKDAAPPEMEMREAGQGAREMAEQLASKTPVRSLLSRLTFGLVHSEDYSWRVGAASEEAVGRELEKLSQKAWFVRHDIMLAKNWNADHIVVGPPGAFVLDTKYRTGVVRTTTNGIRVDGYKTNMAEKVQEQAREISRRLAEAAGLRAWVQPVLVFDNEVRGRKEPDGVHVVDLLDLVDYLREMPRELDARTVERLGRALGQL